MRDAETGMSVENFDELMDFVRRNPEFTNMKKSPEPSEWLGFYEEVKSFPYVREMLECKGVKESIKILEDEYQKWRLGTNLPKDGLSSELVAAKRLEREVRFVLRMARLVGPAWGEFEAYFYRDQKPRLQELLKSLYDSRNKIGMLLGDKSFLEAVASDKRVARLNKLRKDLNDGMKWLDDVKFNAGSYFVQRDTSGHQWESRRVGENSDEKDCATLSRDVLGRIVDACFRIYGVCSPSVLNKLNGFGWLPKVNHRDVKRIIEMALDKKTGEYNFLLEMTGDLDTVLDEQMYELTSEWSIERNTSPPWMEA